LCRADVLPKQWSTPAPDSSQQAARDLIRNLLGEFEQVDLELEEEDRQQMLGFMQWAFPEAHVYVMNQ
jgi:hypothetical protein